MPKLNEMLIGASITTVMGLGAWNLIETVGLKTQVAVIDVNFANTVTPLKEQVEKLAKLVNGADGLQAKNLELGKVLETLKKPMEDLQRVADAASGSRKTLWWRESIDKQRVTEKGTIRMPVSEVLPIGASRIQQASARVRMAPSKEVGDGTLILLAEISADRQYLEIRPMLGSGSKFIDYLRNGGTVPMELELTFSDGAGK